MATQITTANMVQLYNIISTTPTFLDEIRRCKLKYINRNYGVEFTNKLARELSIGSGSDGKSPLWIIMSKLIDEY